MERPSIWTKSATSLSELTALALLAGLALGALPCGAQDAIPAPPKQSEKLPFTVYKEPERDRHFAPSGQIGDAEDITLIENCPDQPKEGKNCIRIEYNAQASKGQLWAGVYWQEPDFNFATVPDVGFNLRAARKITFWVRGEKGGEKIEVKAGGIKGLYPDSFDMPVKLIDVTKSWKKHTLSLADKDLTYVIGGFFVSFSKKNNPGGAVIFLDDIIYE